MNADAFRHLYAYHFAANRKIWDSGVTRLSDVAFTRDGSYSHGSVRDQVLHLMGVDDAWFSEVRDEPMLEPLDDAGRSDRRLIRARWDEVEGRMRDYLASLRDDMLAQRPVPEGEDAGLRLWQILIHVVNHGTDHRAQLLRQLNDLGVDTESQGYFVDGGHLRDGKTLEEARDVLWAYTSPELYERLVLRQRWPLERYGQFVSEGIIAALLP